MSTAARVLRVLSFLLLWFSGRPCERLFLPVPKFAMAIRPSSRLMPSLSFLLSPSRSSSSSPTHLCSLQLPCSGSVSPFVSPSFPHSLATRCPRWGTSLSRSRSLTSQSSSSSSSSAPSSVSPSSLSSPCHSPSSPSSHSAPSSCSFSRSRGHTSLSSGPSWVSSFVLQDASSERKTVFDERKEAALAAIAPSVALESVALPAASGETLGESVLLPPASFRAPRPRFSQRTSPSHPGKTYESATAAGGETCRGGDGRHRKDRSKKGSVDEEIRPLLDAINKLKNFYTSSSCAGRILLVGTPFENSQEKETVCPSSRSAVPDSAPSLTASSPADKSASPSVFQDVREARAGPRGLEQEAKREERGDRSASQATQTGGKPIQERNGNDEGAASPEAASEGKRKKHSFVFLLNHHQKVDAHQLLHAVAACPIPCQEIWLKVEAPILHVCCRSLTDALNLIRVARPYTHRAVLLHASSPAVASSSASLEALPRASSTSPSCGSPPPTPASSSSFACSMPSWSVAGGAPNEAAASLGGMDGESRAQRKAMRAEVAADQRHPAGKARRADVLHCRKEKETQAEERKGDSARYIVEMSNSSRLAVPILVPPSCWLVPLPRLVPGENTKEPHRRLTADTVSLPSETVTSTRETESAPNAAANMRDETRAEKTSVARTEAALLQTETQRKPRRAAAGAECRRGGSEPVSVQTRRDEEEQDERTLTENGGTLCGREDGEKKEAEDQGKEIAERILWERWLTLARLCNQALEESRTRFFELEKQIQKLSQPSLESSSDRPAQQNR
ncbi:hypothetical protein TGME49_227400 [Toxoplasma gondii ME49]|uniref:tRNA(Phe) 7-[(3-amino-3-carboxypropyl)-4-demethylwyosine(37)-N(4)]-methyltransferase n=5 Tax=Toxoplasma gondii TaxID=5811 RepID=S8GFM1_TOXGM|nr:hypothetical protein TGME49_227400 [Toxoplasma gondii ME49]EPT27229.1 hypothetical protein TGME49_227400 [Toxoplasma gondii ME49]|eukprot:XP_018636067.1 hypothetical protein TGME49_227400 [Toxoplasma gondii ME49]